LSTCSGREAACVACPCPDGQKRRSTFAALHAERVEAAGITDGRLFRAISVQGRLEESISPEAVYLIVRHYTTLLGFAIAPHDLRRTFARLVHNGKAPLEQIQLSLGHDSIVTTERYLGTRQNLQDAPCDRLGIKIDNQ
jgi:integrase